MSNHLSSQVEKILPEDIINTLQSGYKVFQGEHDQFDDMIKHSSTLLRKASRSFTPVQLVIGIALLATVAVIAVAKTAEALDDDN